MNSLIIVLANPDVTVEMKFFMDEVQLLVTGKNVINDTVTVRVVLKNGDAEVLACAILKGRKHIGDGE